MTPERLERILAAEDPIEPSSSFGRNVMAAVRREAAEPAPLPFPWPRFMVGLAACVVMAAAAATVLLRIDVLLPDVVTAFAGAWPTLGYAALALIGSLALTRLPRVFTPR